MRTVISNLTEQFKSHSIGNKMSIIIPAYNEEAGIAKTLTSLVEEKSLSGAEIIVVDDGSTDRTAEIVGQFSQIKLIRHPFNRGYGSAICSGTRASKGEYLFWFDSDGQHRVEDLIAVAENWSANNWNIVSGSAKTHLTRNLIGYWENG